LENLGNGRFKPYCFVEDETFYAARVGVANFNGDGRPNVVLRQEVLDFENKVTPWSPLV
jgi:hypothetical protein